MQGKRAGERAEIDPGTDQSVEVSPDLAMGLRGLSRAVRMC